MIAIECEIVKSAAGNRGEIALELLAMKPFPKKPLRIIDLKWNVELTFDLIEKLRGSNPRTKIPQYPTRNAQLLIDELKKRKITIAIE